VPSKVGGLTQQKYQSQQGGSMAARNQPFKQPPTSTITLKELHWRNLPDPIPTMTHFL